MHRVALAADQFDAHPRPGEGTLSLGPLPCFCLRLRSRSARSRSARSLALPALSLGPHSLSPLSAHPRPRVITRAALDGWVRAGAASAARPRCGAALGAARPSVLRGPRYGAALGAAWPRRGVRPSAGRSAVQPLLVLCGGPRCNAAQPAASPRRGAAWPSAGRAALGGAGAALDAVRRGPQRDAGAALGAGWKVGSRACRKRNEAAVNGRGSTHRRSGLGRVGRGSAC